MSAGKSVTSRDLNGARWSKGLPVKMVGADVKEVAKSSTAIEEHRHCQHHTGSNKIQPLSPGAF